MHSTNGYCWWESILPTDIVGEKDLYQHILLAGKTSTNRYHGGNDYCQEIFLEGKTLYQHISLLGKIRHHYNKHQ